MSGHQSVHLLGGGGHAKVVIRALQDLGYTVARVFDDRSDLWGTSLLGVPVVGPLEQITGCPVLPTVISIGDNVARRKVAERFDLPWMTVVDRRAQVDCTVHLGTGTVVLHGAVIQVDTRVGDHVIVNTAASVDHDCLIGDCAHIAPGVRLAGNVVIGAGALLGTGAIVNPGITVGTWTTVGSGGVVVRNLPPKIVAKGVPARVTRPQSSQELGGNGRVDLGVLPPAVRREAERANEETA